MKNLLKTISLLVIFVTNHVWASVDSSFKPIIISFDLKKDAKDAYDPSLPENPTEASLVQLVKYTARDLVKNPTEVSLVQPVKCIARGLLEDLTEVSLIQPVKCTARGLLKPPTVFSRSQPVRRNLRGLLKHPTVFSLSQPPKNVQIIMGSRNVYHYLNSKSSKEYFSAVWIKVYFYSVVDGVVKRVGENKIKISMLKLRLPCKINPNEFVIILRKIYIKDASAQNVHIIFDPLKIQIQIKEEIGGAVQGNFLGYIGNREPTYEMVMDTNVITITLRRKRQSF